MGQKPMRREIQIAIEDYLSEMLLKENFKIGTTVKVDANRNDFKFSFIEKRKSRREKPSIKSLKPCHFDVPKLRYAKMY